jgi:redox-sensing transcriptional repressor
MFHARAQKNIQLKPRLSRRLAVEWVVHYSLALNMNAQIRPARLVVGGPATTAAAPPGAKAAFPESILRHAKGLRQAGLPCVKRMPSYLQLLRLLQAEGRQHVSGTVLATVHNLEPVIVRKDLAMTGAVGTPRIGFAIPELIAAIERFLGWDNQTKAVLVGAGSLGTALLGYQGFEAFGFRLIGAFDQDPRVVGQWIHGRKVQAMDQLAPFIKQSEILLGVLAVPAAAAQTAAELLAQAGIKGIWNFSPAKLQLPADVVVQKEDLAEGLAVLSHRMRQGPRPPRPGKKKPRSESGATLGGIED